MKRILAFAAVALAVSAPAWAQATSAQPRAASSGQTASPEQQVRRITEEVLQAIKQWNVALFLKHMADDVFLFDPPSHISTKADLQKEVTRPIPAGAKADAKLIRNMRVAAVKVQGDNAASIGRVWRSDGKKIDTTFIYNFVFARRNGEWKIISGSQQVWKWRDE